MIKGSCLCGAVQYQVKGSFEAFFLCHCSRCRKDTGSAHGSRLFSHTARLSWLSGEGKVKTFKLAGTRFVTAFCEVCGGAAPVLEIAGQPGLVVPAGSLDTDWDQRPMVHISTASRAAWDKDLEALPCFEGLPG